MRIITDEASREFLTTPVSNFNILILAQDAFVCVQGL